jgi:SAM-dependent methyltransferase
VSPTSTYRPASPGVRLSTAVFDRGVLSVARSVFGFGAGLVAGLPAAVTGSTSTFALDGSHYPYLYQRSGMTWLNERMVEVPVAAATLESAPAGSRILEVGNVLSHYGHRGHAVVDKYERASGVLNVDALEFSSPERYDLIVSISTIEHIGWDEQPRDPARAERTVRHLASLLKPGGRLLVTLPVGYNPILDRAIRTGAVSFDRLAALRLSRRRTWQQVLPTEAWGAPYDHLLCAATAVVIGCIDGR